MLEGLQDSCKDVRLASAQATLHCQPKPLRSADLRLLLETVTSEESEEVIRAILDFFQSGPKFSEPSYAAVVLEWLASLSIASKKFFYDFGITHAEMLYLAGNMLEKCRQRSQEGVFIALSGASSIWGFPITIQSQSFLQSLQQYYGHFTNINRTYEQMEKILFNCLVSQLVIKDEAIRSNYPNLSKFIDEFLICSNKEQRNLFLKSWTGFEAESFDQLKAWEIDGVWKKESHIKFSPDLYHDLPPFKIDFELAYQIEFMPAQNCNLGIKRFKVFARGKNVNGLAKPVVCTGDGRRFILQVHERRDNIELYEVLSIPFPFIGSPSFDAPDLRVEY